MRLPARLLRCCARAGCIVSFGRCFIHRAMLGDGAGPIARSPLLLRILLRCLCPFGEPFAGTILTVCLRKAIRVAASTCCWRCHGFWASHSLRIMPAANLKAILEQRLENTRFAERRA